MFYRINNKTIFDILEDFHCIVVYPPPVKLSKDKMFYPWQVWTNVNWFANSVREFKMSIASFNLLNGHTVRWIFGTTREIEQFIFQKFKNISPQQYSEFNSWLMDKYLKEGWSYGIVDTYDDQEINTDIMYKLKTKKYDYSCYIGCVTKI